MLRRRALLCAPLLLIASMLLLSRTPRAGIACTSGQAACIDERSAVFCGEAGAYRAIPCRGRDGCHQEGAKVSCDQSVAVAGDACPRPAFACTADKANELSCQSGEFALAQSCGGPFGCRFAPFDGVAPGESGNVLCDNDVAREGDPCLDEGDSACTSDRRQALTCVDKRLIAGERCEGPGGCRIRHPTSRDTQLDCDTSPPADAGAEDAPDE